MRTEGSGILNWALLGAQKVLSEIPDEGGDFLLQRVDARSRLAQAFAGIGRLRAVGAPQPPAAEAERGQHQQDHRQPWMAGAADRTARCEGMHRADIASLLSLRQAALPYRLAP